MSHSTLNGGRKVSDIDRLALKAAREIDFARRGKPYNEDDVFALVECLRANNLAHWSAEGVRTLAPTDITIMSRALSASARPGQVEPTTVEELASGLEKLLGIDGPLSKLSKEHLEELLAFCVALHDEALSQRRSFQELRRPKSQNRV